MAKEKKESKKEAKEEKKTLVSFLKTQALKGAKDKATIVAKALETANKEGVTVNSKGKPITKENATSLLNAMARDIKNKKKGWWSNMDVVEEENEFKFVEKEKL